MRTDACLTKSNASSSHEHELSSVPRAARRSDPYIPPPVRGWQGAERDPGLGESPPIAVRFGLYQLWIRAVCGALVRPGRKTSTSRARRILRREEPGAVRGYGFSEDDPLTLTPQRSGWTQNVVNLAQKGAAKRTCLRWASLEMAEYMRVSVRRRATNSRSVC